MAKQEVLRFIEAARAEETIFAELEQAATPDDVVRVAARRGFQFTVEELESVRRERGTSAPGELGDAQLDQVTGGLGTLTSDATQSFGDKYGSVKVQFHWDRE